MTDFGANFTIGSESGVGVNSKIVSSNHHRAVAHFQGTNVKRRRISQTGGL